MSYPLSQKLPGGAQPSMTAWPGSRVQSRPKAFAGFETKKEDPKAQKAEKNKPQPPPSSSPDAKDKPHRFKWGSFVRHFLGEGVFCFLLGLGSVPGMILGAGAGALVSYGLMKFEEKQKLAEQNAKGLVSPFTVKAAALFSMASVIKGFYALLRMENVNRPIDKEGISVFQVMENLLLNGKARDELDHHLGIRIPQDKPSLKSIPRFIDRWWKRFSNESRSRWNNINALKVETSGFEGAHKTSQEFIGGVLNRTGLKKLVGPRLEGTFVMFFETLRGLPISAWASRAGSSAPKWMRWERPTTGFTWKALQKASPALVLDAALLFGLILVAKAIAKPVTHFLADLLDGKEEPKPQPAPKNAFSFPSLPSAGR